MCGIVGYVGEQKALPIIIEGLRKLEYRGYDSAGIAVIEDGEAQVKKTTGRLANLENTLNGDFREAQIGIGHTRWATHGGVTDENAHPHTDCTGNIIVIHNGIIENFMVLREWLTSLGHQFKSETDTEVIPHLIEHYYRGNLEEAVRKAVAQAKGAYALVVMSQQEPDKLVVVRLTSPVIVGLGEGENFIASDIPAILQHTRKVYILNDGEMAVITRNSAVVTTLDGRPIDKEVYHVKWDAVAAEKGGYPHFMLKEIHEQPKALRDTVIGRISEDGDRVILDEFRMTPEEIWGIKKVAIVACGTASHAGLIGKHLIEKMAKIPVEWEIASEYRYRDPMADEHTLLVAISQSGETVDTLAALREAKGKGARVLAISNVVGSSITREAHDTIYTWAGPEIAVASTKAYTTQILALSLLACHLAAVRATMPAEEIRAFLAALRELPVKAEAVIGLEDQIKDIAFGLSRWEDVFYIGRKLDYAVAMEGQLKLKEISYIHAEAYAAGELKHGTIALLTKGVPVIALATQRDVLDKMISNITECRARNAHIISIAREGDEEVARVSDQVVFIPDTPEFLTPALAVLPLQILAYYAAVARGCDVDKPRNLAKSVTVE